MSERLVPVATFSEVLEARMAVNLLTSSGIPAVLEGEEAGSVWAGVGIGDQLRVLVPAEHAPRAAALIADAQEGVLDDDWEVEAEKTAVCGLCGEPLTAADAECPACRTPLDGITARPRPTDGRIRPDAEE